MKTVKSLSWIVILIGLWELFSPFILDVTAQNISLTHIYVTGLALLICGGLALFSSHPQTVKYAGWTTAVLGLWLIIAPSVLGYDHETTPMWNDVLAGILILTSGLWLADAASGEESAEDDKKS